MTTKTHFLNKCSKEELLERLKRIGWGQYQNPDPRCTYPFDPCPAGYCWGYAIYIDGGEKPECENCECWKPNEARTERKGETKMRIEQEKEKIARNIVSQIITSFKERWSEAAYDTQVQCLKNLLLHTIDEGRVMQAKDDDNFNRLVGYEYRVNG